MTMIRATARGETIDRHTASSNQCHDSESDQAIDAAAVQNLPKASPSKLVPVLIGTLFFLSSLCYLGNYPCL